MSSEELLQLIAKVLAWQDGVPLDEIELTSKLTDFQDNAQQCAEDLGLA